MKSVLFGATGFIGSHVAEALIEANKSTVAIVRPGADTTFLKRLGIKVETLDDFSTDTLCSSLRDCNVVYNCIADVHLHKTLKEYDKTQVELTTRIAEAAATSGVTRFVQLSTVKVYGETPNHLVDEEETARPLYDFHQTMINRETALLKVAKNTEMDVVILRPAATFGQRSAILRYFLDAHKKGNFPVIGQGETTFSAVDTRDIGRAMVFLGKTNLNNEKIFNLKGYETSWLDIKEKLDLIRGLSTHIKSLPVWLAKLLAAIAEKITPYGKSPALTRFMVYDATRTFLLDDTRIRQLGFAPKYNIEETMRYVTDEPITVEPVVV